MVKKYARDPANPKKGEYKLKKYFSLQSIS